MMNKLFFPITAVIFFTCTYAFKTSAAGLPDGFKPCASHTYIDWVNRRHPGYADAMAEHYATISNKASQKISNTDVYDIPVVVHVVYNSQVQNLSDEVIKRQIDILNRDFTRTNADTVNLRPVFAPLSANDANVRFHLATTDPQGQATTGITRTSTNRTSFADFTSLLGDLSAIERVKSSADGGIDPWDTSRYLNIWVCNMALPLLGVSILGYATPPPGLPNWPSGSIGDLTDGVVIQYQCISDNNPNPLIVGGDTSLVLGRTVVHEVGHYLGLRHIWGDNDDCLADDGVDDTPLSSNESSFDCDITRNTCLDLGDLDYPDMIENYMDYSSESCQNTFTKGQVSIMRTVCSDYRQNLAQITNGTRWRTSSQGFKILPNPSADGNIRFVGIPSTSRFVDVIDISGKFLGREWLQNTGQISLSHLQPGLYFLQVDGSVVLSKFLRE
jgi:hypothetical protein